MNDLGEWFAANWGTITGWVAAVVGPYLVYRATSRKTDIDESAIVLGKWKELVDAHERSLASLNREIDSLRDRLVTAEKRISDQDGEIAALREENAGLRRAIAQNSQSTAMLIGAPERYTHNKRGGK